MDAKIKPGTDELKKIAKQMRIDILKMLTQAGSGHTGGALSCVEILIALYYCKLRHDPKNPKWDGRDIFVLSKGHSCPTMYATLAYRGFFPKEELMTLRKFGARLQGHAFIGVPGVESSSGSLGQGLSIANGFALAAKLDKSLPCKEREGLSLLDKTDRRVYVLMGDGETQEGQIWEAAMTAAHYKLDNVCAIIDYNKLQIDGCVKDIKCLEPVVAKWQAFGWNVIEADGHDFEELARAYNQAETVKAQPTIIIAHTVKGKGVSFIENQVDWHGIAPTHKDLERALKELEG